jgi:3'-phosphoadenosine 5'-phosphosulfate sulfotransferase (PAPS reductase)/FAD synthetase
MNTEAKYIQIENRSIEKVIPYENNPRVNDSAVDAVAASIKEFGFRTPILCDNNGVIIAGHTRLKAACKLNLKTVPVIIADDLPPEKVQALRIADNQLATLAKWDDSLLELELSALQSVDYDLSILGFDEDELAKLLEESMVKDDAEQEINPTELDSIEPESLSIIENCDRVVLQFSGGKDSTVAINWARGVCEKLGKPLEAVFVETGAEFPDLTSHIIRVCEKLNVKLVLLKSRQNIIQYFCKRKEWPDSIYRQCLHKFINDPVNRHIRTYEGENVICVRGGRSDQKTTVSKSNLYQEVKDGERIVRLLNPFFGVDKAEYEKALEKVKPLLWRGYDLGFVRTACWACPFQKTEQWDALKKHYPLLWEEMRILSRTLEYKKYKGDSTRKRFREYWSNQH